MQLAGALCQELYLVGIHAADQFIEESTRRHRFNLKIGFTLQHAVVIAADRIQSKCPDIAFIRHCALQEANHSWLRLCPAIFECSDEGGHIWEMGLLRKEPRDFHVRVHPVLEFTIEFQKELVVKEHRRVALLSVQNM